MTVKIFGHDDNNNKRKIFRTRTNQGSASSTHVVSDLGEIDYRLARKALVRFHNKDRHKLDILRHQLLPWLARRHPANQKEISSGRNILLRWWRALMNTVVHTVYNERSYYFEAILEIMIRPEFVEFDRCGSSDYKQWANLDCSIKLTDPAMEEDYRTYRSLLLNTLQYAIDRLNQKAVYSNVIVFCAKIFALSFFKIPGMSKALLQVLTLPKSIYRRVQTEMGWFEELSNYRQDVISVIPHHLRDLICDDYRTLTNNIKLGKSNTPKPIEQAGNWLRRWQSDDSELFFAFYKHYHMVLKEYLQPMNAGLGHRSSQHNTAMLSAAPAYVFLASFFQGKIDSLLHREINSVTTIVQWDSNGIPRDNSQHHPVGMEDDPSFEANPVIGGSSTDDGRPINTFIANSPPPPGANHGKPKVLELATRRYADCVVKSVLSCDQGTFHGMADVWVRTAIKRTKLCAVESIFCLFDLLEMIVHDFTAHPEKNGTLCSLPINVPFILETIRTILQNSDHTVALVRTLSFVYNHFELLTRDPASANDLCLDTLLNPSTFERLLLHWSRNVRVFFIRTLIWRVGTIWKDAQVSWSNNGIVPDNVCQQDLCWSRLHQSGLASGASIGSFHAAYERSALEAHIILESLLGVFYTQFNFIESKIDDLQPADRLRLLSSLSPKDYPKLVLAPTRERRASLIDQYSETESKVEKPKRALTFSRSTKKKNGGDKIMRFFSMRSAKDSRPPLPSPSAMEGATTPSSTTTSTIKSSILLVSSGVWSEEDDNQSSNTAASTSSSNVSVMEPKNGASTKNSVFSSYMSQTYLWRYEGKSHVYAKKAVAEASNALLEFESWEQKMKTRCGAGMPCLGLDWPKNWSDNGGYQQ
ncbi:hypothetical protein K450DRAFT_195503 [Umbelopsis ramanniana AG]|uniref:Uncharacterized protein n=1 Tax=Umbelopsis ramanniana AG TaxID=1314678 RepID=A0AAD5HIK1_UMBRA|nr:uncharacterized protein K450DRAFT_195503 [Umbelopsis ramanniana AG]KAI8583756.1 hypothetical protein K450DRAFT_195503 [Umbelopsis ramanniana AG]